MTAGRSIIENCWKQLDQAADTLVEDRENSSLRGYARGLAYAIQQLSQPHFQDSSAVLQHANRRLAARNAGEECPTPGCDGYNPIPPVLRDLRRT